MKSNGHLYANSDGLTRREFLRLASLATAGMLSGCATNPVTGKSQLMLMSEQQEIEIDKNYAPVQFSADYGKAQDPLLRAYIQETGQRMTGQVHRPHMPYAFQVVNATYINAYAFPGGSIAITRGILLSIDNEAELAALIGHELGHVNARHTAQQMSKGTLTQAVIGGLSIATGAALGQGYGQLASQLGMVSAGALLAAYSRDNEREADALGLAYMARSGYGADGFVGLMDMLRSQSKTKNSAIELMFATHPMSDERYQTAVENVHNRYQADRGKPLYRERYMDNISGLRRIAAAVDAMQNGEKALIGKKYAEAESQFNRALKIAPNDYTALVMMAKCQYLQENWTQTQRYIAQAQRVYPEEAQAWQISGIVNLKIKNYAAAYTDFDRYDKLLPGSPKTTFFRGYAKEGMNERDKAAAYYYRYLQMTQEGKEAQHAYQRLKEWGYIR
jgi:beta-barrel assembly-enhancing protease